MALQQREVFIATDETHESALTDTQLRAAPFDVGLLAPAIAATGSVTLGQVADGNTVTIDDGVNPALTFEFDTGAIATGAIVLAAARPAIGDTITLHGVTFELTDGTGAQGDNIEIDASDNADLTADGAEIVAAIKANIAGLNNAGTAGALDTDYTITLTWGTVGEAGNSTITKVGDNITVTSMTGGLEPGDAVTPGNIGVVAVTSGSASAANLLAAINGAALLDITASHTDPASGTINLTHDTPGAAGNVAVTKNGAPVTVTGLAGGKDAVDLYELYAVLDNLDVTVNPGDINIGNVDIASYPVVAMTTVTGAAASSGDNTLIAAPGANTRIVVHDLQLQLEAATATTMLIKSGSTTRRRLYAGSAGEGLLLVFEQGKEFRLGTNEALILNLSGANSVGYTVRYATEAA